MLAYCEREGIGFIPWFPLAAGALTAPGGSISRIAAGLGLTTSQLALAWLLWRSPVMLPIPGTSRVQHLEENVLAALATLSQRHIADLEQATLPADERD